MTGTTRVAQAFRALGCEVVTSDLSQASTVYSAAYLEPLDPSQQEHLRTLIAALNSMEGVEGWLTRNYSGPDVKAWQRHNCMKADAIRSFIENHVTNIHEKRVLISSLIMALDKCDNTVGVQAAFLKDWCHRSHFNLELELPLCVGGQPHTHIEGDCLAIEYPSADLAYIDPPYTWHNYGVYYNVYDSIVLWDSPNLVLTTNRREDRYGPNRTLQSGWNSAKTATAAFTSLFQKLDVTWIVVSYSRQALLPIDTLMEICRKHGDDVTLYDVNYKKHNMTAIGNGMVSGARTAPDCRRTVECIIIFRKKHKHSTTQP